MSFPSLKLTYFNIEGRVEPIRLLLNYAGIPFDDIRLSREEFAALKPTLPLGQVPILEVDGKVINQCDAILRYAGKISKTYPTSPTEAAIVEEVIATVNEMFEPLGTSSYLPAEEKKAFREKYAQETLAKFLRSLEKRLSESPSGYLLGKPTPSVGDFKIYLVVSTLRSGFFDHVPVALIDSYPSIVKVFSLLKSLPELKSYFDKVAKNYPSIKLTYFDIPGRAEPIRLALKYAGVPFVDERLTHEQFASFKAQGRFPIGSVPVLEIDGVVVAQSEGLLRFAGTLSGTYPVDPESALEVDVILETIGDVTNKIGSSGGFPDEFKKAERQKVVEKTFPLVFGALEKRLATSGSGFLTKRISIADFRLFQLLASIKAGKMDFVPAESVAPYPLINKHSETIRALPQLASHFNPPVPSA